MAMAKVMPDEASLHRLIDRLFPASSCAAPVYDPDMAVDGNTRVGGVGEYSIRAAQGDLEYVGRDA